MVQQKTTREMETENFTTHRSWSSCSVCLEEPHTEVKAECREIGPRPMCLLGSMGEVFWGSQAKAGLVNSNKQLGFGKAQEGLI